MRVSVLSVCVCSLQDWAELGGATQLEFNTITTLCVACTALACLCLGVAEGPHLKQGAKGGACVPHHLFAAALKPLASWLVALPLARPGCIAPSHASLLVLNTLLG